MTVEELRPALANLPAGWPVAILGLPHAVGQSENQPARRFDQVVDQMTVLRKGAEALGLAGSIFFWAPRTAKRDTGASS